MRIWRMRPPADIGMAVTQEISLGSAEVLGILTEELESAKEPLTKELQRFTTLNNQETAFFDAARQHKMATSPSHNTPSPASPTHTGKAHCGRI